MSARIRWAALALCAMTGLSVMTFAAWADDAANVATKTEGKAEVPLPGDPTFVALVVGGVLILLVLALVWIRNAIQSSTWSLADALSEEANITPMNGAVPVMNGTQPMVISELRASSSRVIALLGAVAIVFLFVGFGTFVLYRYGMSGQMPDVGEILKFLSGGLALFAPYAVNKLSSVGSSGK
jgi:hypothetical protein